MPPARGVSDREKEVLAKQFEQRIAGMRLERDQGKVDKSLLRRLEKELAELKSLSVNVLGPASARGAAGSSPPGGAYGAVEGL